MTKNLIFTLTLSILFASVAAQDTLSVDTIKKYTYSFQSSNGKISGQGWDSLQTSIAASQFVVLGENHASDELSKLVAVMLVEMKPLGFGHFIIETGPIASQKITELYNKDRSIYSKNLHDFMTTFKLDEDSPPTEFTKMKSDVDMYKSAIENGFQIQGIDKEYYSSYKYLLNRLEKYCKSTELRKQLSSAEIQLSRYDSLELIEKNFKRFSSITNDNVIKSFLSAVSTTGEPAQQIVREIYNSLTIYGHYEAERYYQSEDVRTTMIKKNFGQYYYAHSKPGKPAKAFIKYGNVHTGRGENHYGIPDIGSAISELANLNGTKSLHIMGMRRYRYNDKGEVMDFLDKGYEVYPNCMAMVSKTEWRVIDLRPLRDLVNSKNLIVGKDEKILIRTNDWVLLTPVDRAYKESLNYD